MNVPVLHGKLLRGLAALAIAGLTGRLASGDDRPVESSPPKSEIVSTNAGRVDSRKLKDDMFKRKFTEDLLRSFNPSGNSLEGMISPPSQNRIVLSPDQARKLKELRDREKYWLFLSPDEFARDPAAEGEAENAGAGPLQTGLVPSSVLERFYHSLDRNRGEGSNTNRGDRIDSRDEEGKGRDKFGLETMGPSDAAKTAEVNPIKALYEAASPKEVRITSPGVFSDIFVPSPIPLGRTEAEKERISEFNKMLEGPRQSATSRNPVNPLSGSSDSALAPGGSPDGPGGLSGVNSLAGQLSDSTMNSYFTKPLGASSQPATLPSGPPPKPSFAPVSPPRRKF